MAQINHTDNCSHITQQMVSTRLKSESLLIIWKARKNVTNIMNPIPVDLLSAKSIIIFKAESPPPQQNRRQVQLVTLVVPGKHQHQKVDVEAQVYFEYRLIEVHGNRRIFQGIP